MPLPSSDHQLLLIRCPACSQRFKVEEDLRGKTVECGACESRFKINDGVIVRGRKIYPGERKDPGVNRFQRVPLGLELSVGAEAPERYGQAPDPALLEPASPLRVLAGMVGVAGMLFMAMLLMFGGSRGGMLDGMPFENRMTIAGFAGVLGTILLIYANPKARLKSAGVGVLLALGVLAVPFAFTDGSKLLPNRVAGAENAEKGREVAAAEAKPKEAVEVAALRAKIGTDPLVKEINRLAAEGSKKQAYGIWLRGLAERNRLLIRDYIFRVTDADRSSANFYPRGDGDYLMVVAAPKQNLLELAQVASALGSIDGVYTELSVIEVRVNNENFAEGPIEKLTNKDNPAFYDLNRRELESIDLERVKRAIQRLAEVEPKIYRTDITRHLISLLGEEDIDFKEDICKALAVWAETPGLASDAAIKAGNELLAKALKVPSGIIELIVKEKNSGGIPLVHQLWMSSPNTWELAYADFGPKIENHVIESFPSTEGIVMHSAIRLLGKVGGMKSLPILQDASNGAVVETQILIENAQTAIQGRLTN
jgi:hypothetical protein